MEKGSHMEYHPIASITPGAPIEFNVTAAEDDYTDIGRTYLYLKTKISKHKPEVEVVTNTDRVAPINLWLHSLFSQVDVKLNNVLITSSVNTYPYRSYLETLLTYGKDAKDGQLSMECWCQDDGENDNRMENTVLTDDQNHKVNRGFKKRHDLLANGKMELIGRLHCDIFLQDRYLPNGVDMNIKLIRSPATFNLIGHTEGLQAPNYSVDIESAVLYVRRVKVNPGIIVEHNKLLNAGKHLKFPLRRSVVNTFTISAGTQSKIHDHAITGQLPRRMCLAMVTNRAYNGSFDTSPYRFQHFNITQLSLNVEGETIPAQPLKMNFGTNDYLRAYLSLFEGTGMLYDNKGNCISRKDYKNGYTIFCFDLTADMADGNHMDPIKHGSVRVDLQFSEPLDNTINVILYSEYENTIQIDRARNVIIDY